MILEDILLLSAMGEPGGGRSHITPRILRHFNIVAYTDLDELTVKHIFTMLTHAFFLKFPENVRELKGTLVETVMTVFE